MGGLSEDWEKIKGQEKRGEKKGGLMAGDSEGEGGGVVAVTAGGGGEWME